MAQPSPLSSLCTANEVAVVMEACPGAESFVNANGSDRSKSSGAAKCLGSWRSPGGFWLGELWAQRHRTRDAVRTGENALPKDDPANVTRFKAAAVKRVQAHRWRRRMGLRCLTVRVSDRELRHLISTGCLSLERSEDAPAVALAALELTLPATLLSRDMLIPIMCPTCRHIGATSAARLPRKLVCFVCKAGHAFDLPPPELPASCDLTAADAAAQRSQGSVIKPGYFRLPRNA
jgi:hypothetical protein